MRRLTLLGMWILLMPLALGGCGGGGGGESGGGAAATDPIPAIDDPAPESPEATPDGQRGTIISLSKGGAVMNGAAGVYFPPQEGDGSIAVSVGGTGASADDPLRVTVLPADDGAAATKALPAADELIGEDSIIFSPILAAPSAMTPGTYRPIEIQANGYFYACSGASYAGGQSATRIDGAVIGSDGRQYVGCVIVPTSFDAKFFLAPDTQTAALDEVRKEIRVVAPLCEDGSCGELAEPADMLKLYSAFYTPSNGTILSPHYYLIIEQARLALLDPGARREAYELMLLEMFTQTYLWEDYADEIESAMGSDTGIPGEVIEIEYEMSNVLANEGIQVIEGGQVYYRVSDKALKTMRSVLGWSKFSTFRNLVKHVDARIPLLEAAIIKDRAFDAIAFRMLMYQVIGAAITESYITTFEERILPGAEDPELIAAFQKVKTDLLGSDPANPLDGRLNNGILQMVDAAANAGTDALISFAEMGAGMAIEAAAATGFALAGVTAATGPIAAIPALLAYVSVTALDDALRFDFERKLLVATATFLHNNAAPVSLPSTQCPADDNEMADMMLAQNTLYAIRLQYDLLQSNYDRWFVDAVMLRDDLAIWLAQAFGIGDPMHIWTLPRRDTLADREETYAAKAIKGLSLIAGCGGVSVPCLEECSEGQTQCTAGIAYACTTNASGCRVWDGGTACSTGACAADGLSCSSCTHACSPGQTQCTAGKLFACTTNASGCRVWDGGTACSTGACAADGLSCSTCTHACSMGQTQCTAGKLSACTTNASGCRIWDGGTACPSGLCAAGGLACESCAPNDHIGCYNDDIYNFNSCNEPGTMVKDCGVSEWTGPTFCGELNLLYQNKITRGCAANACTQSTASTSKFDCGSAGCKDGACCDSHDYSTCHNGDVYWYSSCDNREEKKQDCTQETASGNNYCSNNDVYRDYVVGGCSVNTCTTATEKRLQADCGTGGCLNGVCCTNHAKMACDGNAVYWYNSCNTRQELVETCPALKVCGGAKCICPIEVKWSPNTLTATKVTGGIRLSWAPANAAWIHHYGVSRAISPAIPLPSQSVGQTSSTSYTDKTGTAGQCYNFVVFGYDACGANRLTSTRVQACF